MGASALQGQSHLKEPALALGYKQHQADPLYLSTKRNIFFLIIRRASEQPCLKVAQQISLTKKKKKALVSCGVKHYLGKYCTTCRGSSKSVMLSFK